MASVDKKALSPGTAQPAQGETIKGKAGRRSAVGAYIRRFDKRPLAYVEVVELPRVTAGHAIDRALAAFGADVINIQSNSLRDFGYLSVTLIAGKRVSQPDLRNERYRAVKVMCRPDLPHQVVRTQRILRRETLVTTDVRLCMESQSYCGQSIGFGRRGGCFPVAFNTDMPMGAVGGADHSHAAVVAFDTAQLKPEFSRYPPDVAKQVQDNHRCASMEPYHMLTDLLDRKVAGWRRTTDVPLAAVKL
ncbi:hypothetical protein DOTSEDRAFT_80785 [Dothistroma septosporum NZE10]|uniref:Uncharacterized protein n=1 Tax=Dothistroma septosporum (strain NZE10 / CBS 128990) TaxID=675120 RepID=M2WMX1_DOTSN|nr:hypothetical protein DOTSEDRAFT_80785 [Dothistroma septosporum NZE10]